MVTGADEGASGTNKKQAIVVVVVCCLTNGMAMTFGSDWVRRRFVWGSGGSVSDRERHTMCVPE